MHPMSEAGPYTLNRRNGVSEATAASHSVRRVSKVRMLITETLDLRYYERARSDSE